MYIFVDFCTRKKKDFTIQIIYIDNLLNNVWVDKVKLCLYAMNKENINIIL